MCVQGQEGSMVMEAAWMGNVMNLFKGEAITQNQPTVALQGDHIAYSKDCQEEAEKCSFIFYPRFSTIAIN